MVIMIPFSAIGTTSRTHPNVGKDLCGGLTPTIFEPVTVRPPFDFSLSVNPTSGTVTAGGSVTVSVTATLRSGTSTPVTFSTSGLPAGASASFSPSQCSPTCTTTMTLSTTTSTPSGTYAITVKALGGGLTRTTTYSLTVQAAFNFSLAVSPTSGTVTAGGSVTSAVTATLLSGASTAPTFSATGLPAGALASFAPSHCVPTCTSTMTLSTDPSTPSGTYSIVVTAVGGGVTHTTGYILTVESPPPGFDFALSVNPATGTVTAGGPTKPHLPATPPSRAASAPAVYTTSLA